VLDTAPVLEFVVKQTQYVFAVACRVPETKSAASLTAAWEILFV
jgi:hypothetical protein